MTKFLLLVLLFISSNLIALEENKFIQFTKLLVGDDQNPVNLQYNQEIKIKTESFKNSFVKPLIKFAQENIEISGKTLLYPFAGADISYPLLLFPNFDTYVLVGLEIAGNPDFIGKDFSLTGFQPQTIGYLGSGFFKTMKMSEQIHRQQGVIPMLVLQIGLLGGVVDNISLISEPFHGLVIDFSYNIPQTGDEAPRSVAKKLYYLRTNVEDSIDKSKFFAFLEKEQVDACLLKASSYKLQQSGSKQLLDFMLSHCPALLQDDTGIAFTALQKNNMEIKLFGNYIKPYGDEFKPYYQKELAFAYEKQLFKQTVDFCYGYGCGKVEANILYAKKK